MTAKIYGIEGDVLQEGDKTSSNIDATIGRLLKVGDFGLGAVTPVSVSNIDAVDIPGGLYRVDGNTLGTTPGGVSSGLLIAGTVAGTTQGGGYQIFIDSVGRMYSRNLSGGTSWQKIYSTVNILGTVSQTAGVPTGAVIERGSNANGEYAKFADGTLICQNLMSVSSITRAPDSGISGLYYSDIIWTFPTAFINTIFTVTGSGADSSRRGWVSRLAASTTYCNIVYFSSTASPSLVNLYVIAIGRWF